jgi:hypothetical protein
VLEGSGTAAPVVSGDAEHVAMSLASEPCRSFELLASENRLDLVVLVVPLLVPPPAAWISDKKVSMSV